MTECWRILGYIFGTIALAYCMFGAYLVWICNRKDK